MILKPLHPKQFDYFCYIYNAWRHQGYSVTLQELCTVFNIQNKMTASQHVDKLRQYGYLEENIKYTAGIVIRSAIRSFLEPHNDCVYRVIPTTSKYVENRKGFRTNG